jgi:simple sugar transport system ATP-binding protein
VNADPRPVVPALALRGITKSFGALRANDAIDLDLHHGEIHALLGENGAGKTTLMRVAFGVLHPDAGELLADGEPVTFRSPRDAIARGIGMVPQHFDLIPELSVAENVVLGSQPSRPVRLERRTLAAEVSELAQRFGI